MSHSVQLIFKYIKTLALFFTLAGCSLFDSRPDTQSIIKKAVPQKVFISDYDSVWRSTHAVLKYPIAYENQETGIIETELIKGIEGWIPPGQQKPPSSGLRYKLTLTFSKGKVASKESVRITIQKTTEVLRDFFSDPEKVETDGIEEQIIFYRIERELLIAEALKKVK